MACCLRNNLADNTRIRSIDGTARIRAEVGVALPAARLKVGATPDR